MTILADSAIKQYLREGRLRIDPLNPEHIGPASLDLRLSSELEIMTCTGDTEDPANVLDTRGGSSQSCAYTERRSMGPAGFLLRPGAFVLGSTMETVCFPRDLCANVTGRSSVGRLGVAIHVTAGFIDPGFAGQITLEIVNLGCRAVKLYAGSRVCQLVLSKLYGFCEEPYGERVGSKYQNQQGPTLSRIADDM